jgi:hypothetical protein
MARSPTGGCAAGRSRPPVIAETWSAGGSPIVTSGYALTTSKVLYVSINGGPHIPTHSETALPDGLRAVVVQIPGLNPERELLPRFTPLNAKGDRIPQVSGRGSEIRQGILSSKMAVSNVDKPSNPASGICRIDVGPLFGLRVGEGSVITTVQAHSGLIGQGYLSCASTSYNLNGWPLRASLLLDAAHPGATPLSLPDMKPLPGHPGIFRAPGPEGTMTEKEMLARRVPGAWLVVTMAKLKQRLILLEHLHASVQLRAAAHSEGSH